MNLKNELLQILESPDAGERLVHTFLKRNLDLVVGTFATSWNFAEAYAEVSFGADCRADLVVLCANSGSWTAHLIELKSPCDPLYTKGGEKSKALRLVERQLAQRIDWQQQNEPRFREVVSKLVNDDDPAQCSMASVHVSAKSELRDPKTCLYVHPHAVIGRSSKLTSDQRDLRRQDQRLRGPWGAPETLTYDRFLKAAERVLP